MRTGLWAICLVLVGCGAPDRAGRVPTGGSRDAGVVTVSAASSLLQPVGPDWRAAEGAADRRCRGWGYDRARPHSGSREVCRIYDRYGRCTRASVTRYYVCSG
jgi:YecR-like lipoprotein